MSQVDRSEDAIPILNKVIRLDPSSKLAYRRLADANKTLAQLKSEMTKFPQMMINVKLPKRVDISQNLQINQVVAEAEKQLDGRGRVLLRPSGTEPVIRVMVEGEDSVLVNNLVNQIADVVRQQVK
mgnify:CR=1 FL=1